MSRESQYVPVPTRKEIGSLDSSTSVHSWQFQYQSNFHDSNTEDNTLEHWIVQNDSLSNIWQCCIKCVWKVVILSHYCALVIFMDLFHHWKKWKYSYLWFSTIIGMLHYFGGFSDSSVGKESICNAGNPSLIPQWRRSLGEGIYYPLQYFWASLVAQLIKNLPAMWETWVGRSPAEGKSYLLQYSGLENSTDWRIPWGHKESYTTEWLSHYFSN